MPFYSKQQLLREYNRWNALKKRNVDRYIEVIYGKTFLSELKMNPAKKRQDQSTASRGSSQQPTKADNRSSKQERPPDSGTRNTSEDEDSRQATTVTKGTPSSKLYVPPALESKSREQGSSDEVTTRRSRQSRWRVTRHVSPAAEPTGEASMNEEEGGCFQADGERREASIAQDIPATTTDQGEGSLTPTRNDSSTTEHTDKAAQRMQASRLQADAESRPTSTIQDNLGRGASVPTRVRHSRSVCRKNKEGSRDDTTTDDRLRVLSAPMSQDTLSGGLAETVASDAHKSSRAVEETLSKEHKVPTSRAQGKRSLNRDPTGNGAGTQVYPPVHEAGWELQEIQALNAEAESARSPAVASHHQLQDDKERVLSSSDIPRVTGQSVYGLRGRTSRRSAFSPRQRSVTRQRFTCARSESGDTVTASVLIPAPSSTSESEVKESVLDRAEGSSSTAVIRRGHEERPVVSKRVTRFHQTVKKGFPKPSQSATGEHGDNRSQLTDPQALSSAPAGDRGSDSPPFDRHASGEVLKWKEPIDYKSSTAASQVYSFPDSGSRDDTQAPVDVWETVKRAFVDASSPDAGRRVEESQDPRNEDLWNLSVVSSIGDIPLLEGDEERNPSKNECDGPQQLVETWREGTAGTLEGTPGGFSSQLEDRDEKPENDESVIDESVEDNGSSPVGSYLPGISHLRDNRPTENQPPSADSPVFPVLGFPRRPDGEDKQLEMASKPGPNTRSRSRESREVFTSPTNFPGTSGARDRKTPQESEQTERVSPRQRCSPTGRSVTTVTERDQFGNPRVRSPTALITEAVMSTQLAPQLAPEKQTSLTTEDKRQDKKTDQSVAMEAQAKLEMYCSAPQEKLAALPRKIRTAAEKKQRWSIQAGHTTAPDPTKDRLKQQDQALVSPSAKRQVDSTGAQTGARKRKWTDSKEGQVRGQSGWEDSLRQKPATVTRFQAGEASRSSKKIEAEKKRWQSPTKGIIRSPTKSDGGIKTHLPPKSSLRDVWKPPPSKKMKLCEGSEQAHLPSQEEQLSVPTTSRVSAPATTTPVTTPVTTPHTPPVLQDKFLYGELIWGKMKGFNWWPGRVVHHHTCSQAAPPGNACWVQWYGDDKVSKLNLAQVTPFFNFSAHFSHSTFLHTALYRRAVFLALLLASTRAGKTYSRDPSLYKAGTPKRSWRPDRAWQQFYELCNDMIGWAKEGFEPGGNDAIMPDEGEQQLPPKPPSPPPSPVLATPTKRTSRSSSKSSGTWKDTRDVVIVEVRNGIKCIEDICIGCGSSELTAEHPFFIGGLCEVCRIEYAEMAYVFDEDGYQCFCCICAEGRDIILCDQPECYRSFCHECIEYLVGPGEVQTILADDKWKCYMCNPVTTAGLLTRRDDWPQKLLLFFQQDHCQNFPPMRVYPPLAMDQRKPIRVLSLFDGIGTGMLVLKDLGVKVDCYYASEINEEAIQVSSVRHDGIIQQLDDVRDITEQEIKALGPFDLLIGGSPCNDLSIANPARKGLFEGTGRLFFEFYRLLTAVRPEVDDQHPFFWLFENVVGMPHQHKMDISRFLQCDPVVVDAKDVSPAHRARYFWGNLPGMNRPNVATDHNALCLQDCLEPNCNRQAQFAKVRTVTSKLNSIKQKNEQILPVLMNGQEDALWCTEMERIFGFPEHYTDIANMSRSSRHKLIGQAWSVPVIKHLLAPLKEYFACETH